MTRRFTALVACALAMPLAVAQSATTLTFEQFNVGDNLATVNAALAPLGVTFDAAFPASFEVVLDPGDPTNKVIRATPFGASGAVDIVANFASEVESVSAEFVTNPDPVTLISLEGWLANQNASAVNIGDFALSDTAFVSSGTLSIAWSNVFFPPSQILAASFGVASGGAPTFNYVDNITFEFVIPEPTTLVLALSAALCVAGRRRV